MRGDEPGPLADRTPLEYSVKLPGRDFGGFEWDDEKSERCSQERGFDFDHASKVFNANCVEWEDLRGNYGEPRFVAVGEVDGQVLTVVWTLRGTVQRIISARLASRRERRVLYGTNREAKLARDP